jgi:hypothetical protein
MIVPGGSQRDQPDAQRMKGRQRRPIERIVDEGTNGFAAGSQLGGLFLQPGFEETQLMAEVGIFLFQ